MAWYTELAYRAGTSAMPTYVFLRHIIRPTFDTFIQMQAEKESLRLKIIDEFMIVFPITAITEMLSTGCEIWGKLQIDEYLK